MPQLLAVRLWLMVTQVLPMLPVLVLALVPVLVLVLVLVLARRS